MVNLAVFLFILCLELHSSFGNGDGYSPTLFRDSSIGNKVKVTCRMYDGKGIPEDVLNPVWYFNGTLHGNHVCTKNATISTSTLELTLIPECEGYIQCGNSSRSDLSLPRLLLSYPVLAGDGSPKERNEIIGDSFVIPCGIRVSATGNFDVTWRRILIMTSAPDPPFNSSLIANDYSLTVEKQDPFNSIYTCTVKAVTGNQNNLPSNTDFDVRSVNTKVKAFFYVEPKITALRIEVNEEDMSFCLKVEATGENNKISWKRNGDDIQPSPPTVKLSDVSSVDTIEVHINNTNVHGEVHTDVALAFVIAPSCSTCSGCNTGSFDPRSSTILVTDSAARASEAAGLTSSEALNWTLIAVAIFLSVALVVAMAILFIVLKYYRRRHTQGYVPYPRTLQTSNSSLLDRETDHGTARSDEDDKLVIDVGGNSVTIRKSRMRNLKDFFTKIDAIISNVVQKLDEDKQGFDQDIIDDVSQLRTIMAGWVKNHPTSPPVDRTVVDNVACDSSSSPLVVNICNLESEPNGTGTVYYGQNDSITYFSKNTVDNVQKDILALLLPTLAEKTKRNN